MKRDLTIGLGAALAVLLGVGIYISIPGHAPLGQPALADLNERTLPDFEAEFNRAAGGVRVILLISPT